MAGDVVKPKFRRRHLVGVVAANLVRCLFQDREGNLWAGLEARGLVRIRHALFASYARTAGMSDETVLCVSEDDGGNTWLGTNGEGVYRIARDGRVRQYGLNEGLSNLFVWTLQPDSAATRQRNGSARRI